MDESTLWVMSRDHPPAFVFGVTFDEAIRSTVHHELCFPQVRSDLRRRNLVLLQGAGLTLYAGWRTVNNDEPSASNQGLTTWPRMLWAAVNSW
jgi:hypothetical protein